MTASSECEMACQAESKPVATSSYDMHGGVFASKKLSSGMIDRFQGWSRFNAATLNDTRIGSFSTSKEDSNNYNDLNNVREEGPSAISEKGESSQSRGVLKKSSSTSKDPSSRLGRSSSSVHPVPKPESVKALPRSESYKGDTSPEVAKAGKVAATSTPRIRHSRSASFAPPYGGYGAKASTPAVPPKSPRGETSRETSRQEVLERQHSRGSSDMAALRGAAADFFSSDSGPKMERYSFGNENSKEGMKSKTASSPENGSVGSRGSSTGGSPTVARTGSSENLFTSGNSPSIPSNGGSRHARSVSCNVGNLLGGATAGSYSGGGVNTGSVALLN